MNIANRIKPLVVKALKELYQFDSTEDGLTVNSTKPEFEGDYTLVLFSFVKQLKKSPEQLGKEIGEALVRNNPDLLTSYNVVKGFLNLVIADSYWIGFVQKNYANNKIGVHPANGQTIIVEYSSPNTNKPLHLGHLRNNFLGWSVAEILKTGGYTIAKTCIVNDRGIHICKSMLAWQKFANGATPATTGIKGDHLVGDYYVKFEGELKQQAQPVIDRIIEKKDLSGFTENDLSKLQELTALLSTETNNEKIDKIRDDIKEIVRNNTPVMQEAKEMLRKWEAGDKEVVDLWKKMNGWVYEGFDVTYKRIGSNFDKIYYESNTYLLGKDIVSQGLQKGVFYKREDGSVWIDLTADGLDEKLVMRKDGTSVYITQDLGLAEQKYEEYEQEQSFYVVGDEQNYHFKVLKLMSQKLGIPGADNMYHLSYGMVELPKELGARMKSREGTVVDADDICDEMNRYAEEETQKKGKVEDFSPEELKELYETLGLGALKFYLLRVDPKKRLLFDPREGIDLHGFTGPFIQYTHARIKSILRKEKAMEKEQSIPDSYAEAKLLPKEKELIVLLEQYSTILEQAVLEHNPSVIAIYAFNVAKSFNTFYAAHSVMNAETEEKKQLRLQLSGLTANVIASAMGLLGIKVPERM